MNHLINIYMSRYLHTNEKIVGNFIADFVKSSGCSKFTYEIADGIILNKRLSSYMMVHPAFDRSRKRLNPKFSKYSVDIIQLFYNHLLAANWNKYSGSSVEVEVNENYYILLENFSEVPYSLRKILPLLISQSGLTNLVSVAGLHNFINEMSLKGNGYAYFQYSIEDLLQNYSLFKEDFEEFFGNFTKFASQVCLEKEGAKPSHFVLAHAS